MDDNTCDHYVMLSSFTCKVPAEPMFACYYAGTAASSGAQHGKQTADGSSLKAKLGAAVRDWKAKHKEKAEASVPKDTAVQAEASAPLYEEHQSRGWVLNPYRVAHPPPLKSLRCGLPSPKYPSDHISLIADFSMSRQ